MTEQETMQVVIQHLNDYLKTAPDTFFTKNNGREVTKNTLMSFLYLHCLEDDKFDNYCLIQAAKPRIVGHVLWEALSSLARISGDTSDGEGFFAASCIDSAISSTKLIAKFDVGYAMRAIANEFYLGDESRWINVTNEHQQLTNLINNFYSEGETP